jgi:GntR family transcriptional repressor for pyruvate dehydrogenase complex
MAQRQRVADPWPRAPLPRSAPAAGHDSTPDPVLSDAVLRPVRDGNAFESTVEHLATAIRLGAFAPGQRLPAERELAERLRVSRATLREAIGALRQAGFVRTTRGRAGGTVVVHRGPEPGAAADAVREVDVADALAFRRVVEPGAAALAAGADLTAEQRAWLVAALHATTTASDDGGDRRRADSRLHLALAALSGSDLVVEAVTQAQSLLALLLSAIPVLRANIEHSDGQHASVVDAVLCGDVERARRLMEEHCDATAALLRGLLDPSRPAEPGRRDALPATVTPAPGPRSTRSPDPSPDPSPCPSAPTRGDA